MATNYEMPSVESYWKSQSDALKEIREQLGYETYSSFNQYKPLPDRHPLLQDVIKKKPALHRRESRTPPQQLPKLLTSPPSELTRHHSPSLHGNKYDVIPPVKPKQTFFSPTVSQKADGNDSWGEEEASSDEDNVSFPAYQGYPYPMVMYPYPVMMAPPLQPQLTNHKPKTKKGNKKVHYRNTPTYLSSREHTKHEPQQVADNFRLSQERTNSVLERYQYLPTTSRNQPLDITDYSDLVREFSQNYVDKFVEEYLEIIIPELLKEVLSELDPMPSSHPYYPASFYYCEEFLDKEIPKLVREVIHESSCQVVDRHSPRRQDGHDPLEEFLNSLLEEVLHKETSSVVKEVAKDIVQEHFEKMAAYEEIQDMIGQIIQEIGPSVIDEAFLENMFDDLLEDEVIHPEVTEQSQQVAVDVLTHYSNKVRNRDIREIKKNSGDKLKDSLCLDYLLAFMARQGELWTEGEHANKLLDEIALNILLLEYVDVHQKKRATVDNKPVRRYYQKVVTNVTLDVLLEEIVQSLDEDMADLDEYEQGLENPDVNYQMPKELKKWFEGS